MTRATEKYLPFKDGLGEIVYKRSSKQINMLPGMPGKVVRSRNIENLKDARVKDYILAKELFKELESVYGIKSVKADLVVGKNERGIKTMFQVVDSINGTDLEHNICLPLEAEEKVDSFFGNLAFYLADKFNKHEPFLRDITKGEQVVYGSKHGEAEKDLYIVDVDPYVSLNKDKFFPQTVVGLYYDIANLFYLMLRVENSFANPVTLTKARKKFLEIIQQSFLNPQRYKFLPDSEKQKLNEIINFIENSNN
jgi:hypothetical protein